MQIASESVRKGFMRRWSLHPALSEGNVKMSGGDEGHDDDDDDDDNDVDE